MRFAMFSLVFLPLAAVADNFPNVTKGPVISGVTSTEAWVAWATAHHQGTGSQCTLEAFLGTHNTDVPTLALSPSAAGGTSFPDATCSRLHRVHLTGLLPDHRYTFTLDKPFVGGATAGGEFRTATTALDARFDFVVYGDNRDAQFTTGHRPDHEAVTNGIIAREPDAAFLLHTGDLALNLPAISGDDRGYTEFFDVERGLLSVKPIMTAIGNHETIDTTEYDDLVNAFGFAGSPHPYYGSFDWGGIHVALLDAFEGAPQLGGLGGLAPGVTDAQATWLDADLAAATAAGRSIFVVSHQSPFSHPDPNATEGHGGSEPMQQKIVPILLKYRVFAIFGGHDHYYQRGHEGCLDYFVVGGGGAPMYEPDPAAPGVAVAVKAISYVVVSVDGTRASATAKSATGAILDTFAFAHADGTACGVPTDVPDAGTVDSGTPPLEDAGPADAGDPKYPDAGEPDAGATTTVDAGTPDAGAAVIDAGTRPDASTAIDAGEDPLATEGGCGCGASGGGIVAMLGIALILRRKSISAPAPRSRIRRTSR